MVWKNIKEDNGKIHIVQWSICERRKLWYEKTEKFYRIQGDPNTPVAFDENTERARELKDLQPVSGGDSDLYKAMQQITETGNGPKDQIPSMGCNIKWINN